MNIITFKSFFITRLITSTLFIIYPFSSFIISILLLANNYDKKFNQIVFALFWGLFGYTFIPGKGFDIIHHYFLFTSFLGSNFNEFLILLTANNQPDIALYTVYWLLGTFTENSQIVGFLGAFTFYYLLILIINNVLVNYLSSPWSFNRFVLVFTMFMACTVPFIFSGMRNGNAIMLFIYLITYKNKRKSYYYDFIVLILPGLVHFSLFPVSIIYLLSKYLSKNLYMFLCVLLILLTPFTLSVLTYSYNLFSLLGGIGDFFAAKIDSYILNPKDNIMYFGAGFRYYLVEIPLFIIIPFLWLFTNLKNRLDDRLFLFHKFVFILFAYSLCTIQTFMFARSHIVFTYIFIIYLLILLNLNWVEKKTKTLILMLCLYVALSIAPSWITGREYLVINPKLFYSNLFELLDTVVSENEYW